MTIANVGLMTPVQKAQADKDIADLAKLDAQLRIQGLEYANKIGEMGRLNIAYGQQLIAESQVRKAAAQAKIEAAQAKATVELLAIDAQSNRKYLVNALSVVILNKYNPTPEMVAKAGNPNVVRELRREAANRARDIAEDILKKHENINTPNLTSRSEENQCMRLLPGTAKVIIDVIKKAEYNGADLTRFKNEIDSTALNIILDSNQITEILFAEQAEKRAQEVATRKKEIHVFCQRGDSIVPVKPLSMSISTSTASSSSPMVAKKNEGNSPDNSPPKALQAGKPLPVPPAKALPKPPAPRTLQAK